VLKGILLQNTRKHLIDLRHWLTQCHTAHAVRRGEKQLTRRHYANAMLACMALLCQVSRAASPPHCSVNASAPGLSPFTMSPTTTSAPGARPPAGPHQSGRSKAHAPPWSGRRVLFQLLLSSAPGGGVTNSCMLLAGAAPLLMTLTSICVHGVAPSLQLLASLTCACAHDGNVAVAASQQADKRVLHREVGCMPGLNCKWDRATTVTATVTRPNTCKQILQHMTAYSAAPDQLPHVCCHHAPPAHHLLVGLPQQGQGLQSCQQQLLACLQELLLQALLPLLLLLQGPLKPLPHSLLLQGLAETPRPLAIAWGLDVQSQLCPACAAGG
jgi:hypothetical protein